LHQGPLVVPRKENCGESLIPCFQWCTIEDMGSSAQPQTSHLQLRIVKGDFHFS
uniref:Protein kinase domain-containing protein n=1 Tax=Parascaris univalens TaxID=6257 RepID=A0A915A1U2_PARUN